MVRSALFLLLSSILSVSAKSLEDVVEKARAFVGPESRLEAVETLRYSGTLTPAAGGETREVMLLLEKPANQRLEIAQEKVRITMVVNQFGGFMIQENLETGESMVNPLPTEQVHRFKANAAENLYFFDFPPGRQVRAKYLGAEEFRGQTVDAVRYTHPHGIRFLRYFDPESGELVGTKTDTGSINTEEGEIEVGGLRFSEKVLSFEGDEPVHTIRFERIEVNPEIPDGAFDPPESE